jgi:hypothetical protein
MSNFDDETFFIKTNMQAIHDRHICRSFDEPAILKTPQVGLVVFKAIGFGVVTMISFNSTKQRWVTLPSKSHTMGSYL